MNVADFNQRWPFEDSSVAVVHMRQLQYGVGLLIQQSLSCADFALSHGRRLITEDI